MRIHIDEDDLLKSALQTLSEGDETAIRSHIAKCRICRRKLEKMLQDVDLLRSVNMQSDYVAPALPRRTKTTGAALMRAAAILVVGFVAGFMTAGSIRPDPVIVVGQKILTKPATFLQTGYSPCEPVDLRVQTY